MSRRIIGDAVFDLAAYLTQECHAQVAQQYAQELARYARLTTHVMHWNRLVATAPRTMRMPFE